MRPNLFIYLLLYIETMKASEEQAKENERKTILKKIMTTGFKTLKVDIRYRFNNYCKHQQW